MKNKNRKNNSRNSRNILENSFAKKQKTSKNTKLVIFTKLVGTIATNTLKTVFSFVFDFGFFVLIATFFKKQKNYTSKIF